MPMNDLEDGEQEAEAPLSKDHVAFLPSLSRTYSLWHRGRYMTVIRTRIADGNMWRSPLDMFKIKYGYIPHTVQASAQPVDDALCVYYYRILTRDPSFLHELLKELRDAYKAANGHLINVYVAQEG